MLVYATQGSDKAIRYLLLIILIVSAILLTTPVYAAVTCQTDRTLSAPKEYQQVAEATGGSVFQLEEGEMSQLPADLLIDTTPREHLLKLTKKISTAEQIALAVDSSIEQLKVHVSAYQPMVFELWTPDQQMISKSADDAVVQSYSSGCVVIIEKPAPGLWWLTVDSVGEIAIDAQAITVIAFSGFEYVEWRGRPGHQGWFTVKEPPEAGMELQARAGLYGIENVRQLNQFQLRSFDGQLHSKILLETSRRDRPQEAYLLPEFTVPEVASRIYVVGIDSRGFALQRMCSHSLHGRPSTKDNIDAEDEYGMTALFRAVYDNDRVKVQSLIDAGADVNHQTQDGVTTVMYAVQHHNCAVLKLLIDQGADVGAIDQYASTAVFKAAVANNPQALRLLLENGAEANIRDGSGYTARQWAQKQNYSEILTLLDAFAGEMVIEVAPVEIQ